jgi:hypothetical protein
VHGGGFLGVLARHVFVGNCKYRIATANAQPDLALDSLELCQHAVAFGFIRIFDLHGGLQVASIRHEGIVGIQLILDACFFVGLFDAQHFLDLVADQEFVFEQQQYMITKKDAAQLLLFEHAGTHLRAGLGIGFQGQQAVA